MIQPPRFTRQSFVRVFVAVGIALLAVPTTIAQDTALAQITIPALAVDAPVVFTPVVLPSWDVTHLGDRIGYLEMTSWFGQGGNTVLAGHATTSDLQPSVWYALDTLVAGDTISVVVGAVQLNYAVAAVYYVEETDMTLVLPTDYEVLTLMTCAVDSWDGGRFTGRIMVVALPTGRVALN